MSLYMKIIYMCYTKNKFTNEYPAFILKSGSVVKQKRKKERKKAMNWRKLGQKVTVLLMAVLLCVGSISMAATAADA